MKEQLISFETAKLAKEKGFIVEVPNYYHPEYGLDDDDYGHKDNYNNPAWSNGYLSAPTQSLLKKWLRDEHQYHVITLPTITMDWAYKIITLKGDIEQPPYSSVSAIDYPTSEQALEQGLIEALKLI